MRQVAPVVYSVSEQVGSLCAAWKRILTSLKLRDTLAEALQGGTREVDVLHWISRASLELLAQGGFGHSFNLISSNNATHPVLGAIKNILLVRPLLPDVLSLTTAGLQTINRPGSFVAHGGLLRAPMGISYVP